MPNDIKVSEMGLASQINEEDYLMIAQQRVDLENEYNSRKTTVLDLTEKILKEIQLSEDLQSVDKTIVGAINEAIYRATVGRTFEIPLSNNPYANEVTVYTETLPSGE